MSRRQRQRSVISTREIKISCVIDEKYSELVLRAGLHLPPEQRGEL